MPQLSVQQLFERRQERLGLAWAAGRMGAAREFSGEMLRKPGVGLIAHLNVIHPQLAQIIGVREAEYIDRLEGPAREQTAAHIVRGDTVCVIVCDGVPVPDALRRAADEASTPVLTSTEPSQHVINVLR